MKYKTFAALRAVAIGVALVGGFVGCRALNSSRDTSNTSPAATLGNVPSPGEYSVTVPAPDAPQQSQRVQASSGKKQAASQSHAMQSGGATEPLDGWQKELIDMQKQPLTNGEVKNGTRKWVVNGGGMHAEFRSDTDKGATGWNRVKIDLNGNKRDDERWDFKPDGTIKRRVAPGDDENFTQTYTLKGNQWVRK